ncbi:MAG: hypothetical protein CM15mP51_21060 [Porticoccaceae bacterium]|nr:MAG: hypothetical protein CM15mP51_21060 [Porticoccaceae bacterium]
MRSPSNLSNRWTVLQMKCSMKRAAEMRDQIKALRQVQAQQVIEKAEGLLM